MHASAKVSLSAIIALTLAAPVWAQDSRRPTSSGTSTGGSAESRGGSGSSGGSSASSGSSDSRGGSSSVSSPRSTATSRPSREPQSSARRPSSSQSSGGGPAIPAYSRPRGSRAVRGVAVDRGDVPPATDNFFYYLPYYGYNGFYGSRYGYGYSPFYTGFGSFYYDPYWGSYYDPYYSRGYAGRYSKDDRDYDIGSLRLKVDPSNAEVFVDGLYRGIVDDFDGVFQRLKLPGGAHRLEVRAAGYQTLVFDVLVTPGETTTYRGDLTRR